MSIDFNIGPYDACPCGSGLKYKFCCAAKAKDLRHGKFPVGTVALYGPDDKTTTKIAAAVILENGTQPALDRFVSTNVVNDLNVRHQIKRLFAKFGVKSVVVTDGNVGCPHEEIKDFPLGEDCPFCPFWAGKQGTARRDLDHPVWDDDEDTDETDADQESLATDELPPSDVDEPNYDQVARIDDILSDNADDREESLDYLAEYLQSNLKRPCIVTGAEDFRWEEPYVLGGWSAREYRQLKRTQPSYTDRYELLGISRDYSPWMLFSEDLCAHVRRISDGKVFDLGLAELELIDKTSPNCSLLRDYAVWFVNTR